MQVSTAVIPLITHFEGFRSTAYQDIVGVWTIGYGTTRINRKPVMAGMTCTRDDATMWMLDDLSALTPSILKACSVAIQQHELDALASFVYNVGIGNFRKSTLLKTIKTRQPILERHFTDWNKARVKGVLTRVEGLHRRRKSEFHLFRYGQVKVSFP